MLSKTHRKVWIWVGIPIVVIQCLLILELKLGELVHDELFGLYDAMAAIELMDPKMDAGMMCNKSKKLYPFEEMVRRNLIKIKDFSLEELIGIIDDTYSCLVMWMNGHSLAQTVFINLYLHSPNLIFDKTLKSFCIVILKIVDIINEIVLQASVYEEEDFQTKTYSFDLASFKNHSKTQTLIKAVDEELKSQIKNEVLSNKSDKQTLELLKALHCRIKFTQVFYTILLNFKKEILNSSSSLPLKEFIFTTNQLINNCEVLVPEWLSTLDYGVKPSDQSNLNVDHYQPNYPTILGFEPLINQRLLPSSFPRYVKITPRADSVAYLKSFLLRYQRLMKVHFIENFFEVINFFNEFSKLKPSCVVSRSMLQLFYMPQQNMVYGEIEFAKVIKDSCKDFIKPLFLSGPITLDPNTKEIVDSFFNRCLHPFKSIIQIYGHNRASQRGKIAFVLKDFLCLIEECISLDQFVTNELNNSMCSYLQFWILIYKFYLMSQYLLSGFELELYSTHEYCYMYYELDYIWDYITLILKRANDIYQQHEAFLSKPFHFVCLFFFLTFFFSANSSNNTKNRKKQMKLKNKIKFKLHDESILYYRGICLMAGGLHRIIMALSIDGKIPQPTQSLNTEQIRYKHRFFPLKFEESLLSYQKYIDDYNVYKKANDTNKLYLDACKMLTQARNQFEAIKDISFQNEVLIFNLWTPSNRFLFHRCSHT